MGPNHRTRDRKSPKSSKRKHSTRRRQLTHTGLEKHLEVHLTRDNQNIHSLNQPWTLPQKMENSKDYSPKEARKTRLRTTRSIPTDIPPQHTRKSPGSSRGKTLVILRRKIQVTPRHTIRRQTRKNNRTGTSNPNQCNRPGLAEEQNDHPSRI